MIALIPFALYNIRDALTEFAENRKTPKTNYLYTIKFNRGEKTQITFATLTRRRVIVPVTFSTSTTTAGNVIEPIGRHVWTRYDALPLLLDVSVTFIRSSVRPFAVHRFIRRELEKSVPENEAQIDAVVFVRARGVHRYLISFGPGRVAILFQYRELHHYRASRYYFDLNTYVALSL